MGGVEMRLAYWGSCGCLESLCGLGKCRGGAGANVFGRGGRILGCAAILRWHHFVLAFWSEIWYTTQCNDK